MRFDLNQEVKERSSKHRRKQRWHKRVSAMAAVVVFCTTYALILPAITMEKQVCELEEHIHAEACYVPFVEESRLELKACSLGGQLSGDDGEQIGEIDLIVHTHDELCYDADGQLMCGLEEVELHRHTADCYESVEPSGGDAPAAEEPPVEEPPAEEPPVEEPPAEEPPIEEPPVEEPPVEEPSVEEPPVEEPPVEEPPVEEPPVEEPPVEEPPAEEPPAEESPVEEQEIVVQIGDLTPAVLMGGRKVEIVDLNEEPAPEEPAVEEVPAEQLPEEAPAIEDVRVEAPVEEAPVASRIDDELVCGEDELQLHTHSADCLDENGELICTLPQIVAHQHTEQCFETVISEPELVKLECTEEEGEAHTHDESCYSYWMLGCGKQEHTHDENCGILFEANLELENDAMLFRLQVFDTAPLPEDLSFELREMGWDDEKFVSYADYALESTPGELRTLSAYEIVFLAGGQEIELPNAELLAEMTVKELDIPEAEDFTPLAAEAAGVEEAPEEEAATEELVVQPFSLEVAALANDTQPEVIPTEEDDTAYQMHLTVLSSNPGGVTDEGSATVESPEEESPVMFMSLGSSRTFALARSVEPLPRFEIRYLCNMLRYYTPSDTSRVLNVINTARTDGSYPVQGEPLGGILPINGRGTNTSPTVGNDIYNLYLEPSSTHSGYFRTAMTYQLVEVYQAQENVIYSNAMTSRHMNVLRDNDHYGVTYIQVLSYEPTSDADWNNAAVYDVNWDSAKTFWNNVDVVDDPDYVWNDVDKLYYFTNNPDAVADKDGREPIVVTNGMVMRYIYFPTSRDVKFDASFFDYDISNGSHTTSGGVTTMYTGKNGINSDSNYTNGNGSGSAELAFGNSNTGSGRQEETMSRDGKSNAINQYNGTKFGSGYKGLTFGIVTGYDPDSGKLTYNSQIRAPYLFNYQPNGKVVGKTSYSNTDMVFRRDGDTYTLTKVEGTDGIEDVNLELFEITYTYADGSHLYSNSFWPFDGINDGTNGHDIHFGSKSAYDNSREQFSGKNADGTTAGGRLPPGDEGAEHNSYFGVEYAVNFHLDGSYTGPLEYLFYGDDDMWVFLTDHQTGQTKLIADIGGVHSSVGSYTDLWDWVPNTAERPNGKGDYTLTFFYTERGASGSSCFMQFTIPDAVGVPMQTEEVGSVEVEKLLAAGMTTDEDFRFSYDIEYPSSLSEVDRDRILPYTIYEGSTKVISGALFREGEFDLKAGQRIIIGNIPVDSTFSVSEKVEEADDYEFKWVYGSEGTEVTDKTVSGTITASGQTIEFDCINTYNSLTLAKKIDVAPGMELPDDYTFEVLLTDANGTPLTGTVNTVLRSANGNYGAPVAVTLTEGKTTVKLKVDESVSFYPLPDGAKYTITETDGGGLLPTWPDGSGDDLHSATVSGTVASGNVYVTCVNRAYYQLPSTGGPGTTLYTMGGLLLMAAAVLLGYKKVRKEACSS